MKTQWIGMGVRLRSSVFGLAIYIENFPNLQIGGYS